MDEGRWSRYEECPAPHHQKMEFHVQAAPYRPRNKQVKWRVFYLKGADVGSGLTCLEYNDGDVANLDSPLGLFV